MATPEIVGQPALIVGDTVRSLGVDVYVPSDATTNLLVVACGFRYTGTGGSTVQPRVDTVIATLSGQSSTGTPDSSRMNVQQWKNLSPGMRRVHVEASTTDYMEKIWLCAVLLRNGGEASLGSITTNPSGGGTPAATTREVAFYWSFGGTAISSGLPSLLSIDVLPESMGSLEVISFPGKASAVQLGLNTTAEVSRMGAYAIVPYAA